MALNLVVISFPGRRTSVLVTDCDVSLSSNWLGVVISVGISLSIFFWSLGFSLSLSLTVTAGKSGFGSLLSLGQSPGKTDRIYMKGPGGRGEVEVAVSGVIGK